MDSLACWVSNPRDMIGIQNALYVKRYEWNNQLIPTAQWQPGGDSRENRKYWGWNEIPVSRDSVADPKNWDSVIIKLPADVCGHDGGMWDTPNCMSDAAHQQLENDLASFVSNGFLVPGLDNIGQRPGSYVVFVREFVDVGEWWKRFFFCDDWSHGQWRVVFNQYVSDQDPGLCYLDHNKGQGARVVV